MKAVEKIKGYYEEHKPEIEIAASLMALSIGWLIVGYTMGDKVKRYQARERSRENV